ncbi:MAG: hypothetical protein ACC651_02120 [Candidatus Scalindua sp.]
MNRKDKNQKKIAFFPDLWFNNFQVKKGISYHLSFNCKGTTKSSTMILLPVLYMGKSQLLMGVLLSENS